MMEQAGKIPRKGEHIIFNNIKLMVDAGDNRKIDKLKSRFCLMKRFRNCGYRLTIMPGFLQL